MLKEIDVENFAIIDKMQLQLAAGFNVLTGETGAGKSLIMDAVALIMGGRAQQDFIRLGADRCFVQGVFTAPFSLDFQDLLQQNGFGHLEDDLLISRELYIGGKSVCRVNGRVVTLSFLKELGKRLVHIHGQMEHILLLAEENQRNLLDHFGGELLQKQLEKTAYAYHQYDTLAQKLQENEKEEKEILQKIDFLQFELNEIREASLVSGEDEALKKEKSRLENAEKLHDYVAFIHNCLEGDGKENVLNKLAQSMASLKQLAAMDENLVPLSERMDDIYYNLEDLAREIVTYEDQIPTDLYRLDDIEKRLQLIRRLQKKYAPSIEEILAFAENCAQELLICENFQTDKENLAKLLVQARELYLKEAGILSDLRKKNAVVLAQKIKNELQELQMKNAEFVIEVVKKEDSAQGFDKVHFLIRTNLGEELLPVAKIASGGEMSRIMLAMRVALAQVDAVPTIIFDEIDTGLGGKALNAVAKKMREVSDFSQVLCVTHAPMLAAFAAHHIYLEKQVEKGRTVVQAIVLNKKERIEEIARMLAGEKMSDITLEQAKELLNQ